MFNDTPEGLKQTERFEGGAGLFVRSIQPFTFYTRVEYRESLQNPSESRTLQDLLQVIACFPNPGGASPR
jgi:hypothetical protein